MKLVFDTNVVVAGLVATGLCHELLADHVPRNEVILSVALWQELIETLAAKFDLEADELPFLRLYHRHATWVEPKALDRPVCRNSDDDQVLATAHSGGAEAIVTGDRDLLDLGSFEGIAILTPRQFLELAEG